MPTCGTGRRAITGVRLILLGRSLKVGGSHDLTERRRHRRHRNHRMSKISGYVARVDLRSPDNLDSPDYS